MKALLAITLLSLFLAGPGRSAHAQPLLFSAGLSNSITVHGLETIDFVGAPNSPQSSVSLSSAVTVPYTGGVSGYSNVRVSGGGGSVSVDYDLQITREGSSTNSGFSPKVDFTVWAPYPSRVRVTKSHTFVEVPGAFETVYSGAFGGFYDEYDIARNNSESETRTTFPFSPNARVHVIGGIQYVPLVGYQLDGFGGGGTDQGYSAASVSDGVGGTHSVQGTFHYAFEDITEHPSEDQRWHYLGVGTDWTQRIAMRPDGPVQDGVNGVADVVGVEASFSTMMAAYQAQKSAVSSSEVDVWYQSTLHKNTYTPVTPGSVTELDFVDDIRSRFVSDLDAASHRLRRDDVLIVHVSTHGMYDYGDGDPDFASGNEPVRDVETPPGSRFDLFEKGDEYFTLNQGVVEEEPGVFGIGTASVSDNDFAALFTGAIPGNEYGTSWDEVNKLFIIDACYSGGFLDPEDSLASLPKSAFIGSLPGQVLLTSKITQRGILSDAVASTMGEYSETGSIPEWFDVFLRRVQELNDLAVLNSPGSTAAFAQVKGWSLDDTPAEAALLQQLGSVYGWASDDFVLYKHAEPVPEPAAFVLCLFIAAALPKWHRT